ncbi:MAG TPA: hypothetical protein VLW45_07600 [Pelomicrobium sp.]|nr:hypothetical protein [Pelomicrobium sp.]
MPGSFGAALAALVLLVAAWPVAHAQTATGASAFNWYYATAFGTGVYRVGGVDVVALKLPFAHTLRPTGPDQWGVRLALPVTIAGADVGEESDVPGLPDHLASIAFVPGIEVEIPLRPEWTLTPYLNAGVGREFLDGSSATIGIAGVRSRYRFPAFGRDAYLGNALVYSRTWTSGPDDALALFIAGLNVAAFDGPDVGNRATRIWGHAIYYGYFNDLEFVLPDSEVVALRNEYELAVSLIPRKPWDVLGFELDAVGLGYRFSNETQGITLFTSFPF